MPDTAIFDVDGTLVDTNYQHTLAWYRSFRRLDITLPIWRLHRATGMGGDLLVAHVAGDEVEQEHGDTLREGWTEEFDRLIGEVRPFEQARELLVEVRRRGFRLVLASSGQQQHVEASLDLLDVRSVAEVWTSSADVENSKPAPDLVKTALDRVDGRSGVMVGDSPFDCQAAARMDTPTLALLSGGFSRQELTDAGAVQVFDSLVELRARLDETPLARPSD